MSESSASINLTLILSTWGAVLSSLLALLEIIKFFKDKASIKVKVIGGYKVYPKNPVFGDLTWISISAVNKGRRPITITKAALVTPRGSKAKFIMGPLAVKLNKLAEGESCDYFINEDKIGLDSSKYVACVIDASGKHFWSDNFLNRFRKLRRIH